METLKNDLKFGLRMLARRPSVTFTILVCLAVGIGASTVVFSLVRGVLLQPLPYDEPDRVVFLTEEFRSQDITGGGFSSLETIDLRERQKSFETIEGMVPHIREELAGEGVEHNLLMLDEKIFSAYHEALFASMPAYLAGDISLDEAMLRVMKGLATQ